MVHWDKPTQSVSHYLNTSPKGCTSLGAVHILRNTEWEGGGLPDLLQYSIGGVFKVYYNITILNGKCPKFVLRYIWTIPYEHRLIV